VAPEAGARQGAPQKRPQQPVLRQPATCRAACRPSVRCVSHIAGLASLCKDVYSPRPGIAPLLRSLHRRAVKTSGERRPGRPGAQPVKGPVAPQAAPEHADRRASGNCKEACSQAHARPGQPRPKPLFGQAATCWVSKSSSSVQPGALLDHPQHRASLAAARTGRCGRQEPVAVQRRAADRGMSRLLCMSYVLLLTTCLAHRSATSALNTTRSMHSRHMHTLLTNIGCRPAYVQETWQHAAHHALGSGCRLLTTTRTARTWRMPGHGLHQIMGVRVAQRVPPTLQGGTKVAAVAPPRACHDAALQLKHIWASPLQKARHKAQDCSERRARGRVRDAQRGSRRGCAAAA